MGVLFCWSAQWTAEQKRRIVEETRAPGASVSVVARRYDVNANLLFKWKRHEKAGGLVVPPPRLPEVVPIGVVGRAGDGGKCLRSRRYRRLGRAGLQVQH